MDEKKVPLSDSLVKAAAWTHNISVNKLGYCPLQLVIGKAVTIPGFITGNVATESLTDAKADRKQWKILPRSRLNSMKQK